MIVQNRKEPAAHIGARLPEMTLGERAHRGALHEIVDRHRIPGERQSITAQPGNFPFIPIPFPHVRAINAEEAAPALIYINPERLAAAGGVYRGRRSKSRPS
jgi:hypothetical protein